MLAKKQRHMSVINDNFSCHKLRLHSFPMDRWIETARKHIEQGEALIQMGEELITSSVAALLRDWQNPSVVLDKLCTGAERWQAAIRQMQATSNFADILRSRTAE